MLVKKFLLYLDIFFYYLFLCLRDSLVDLKTLPACIQLPQIFWQCICNEECLKKKAKCRKTLQNKAENVKYVQNLSLCVLYLFWQYHSSLYLLCQGANNQCYLELC